MNFRITLSISIFSMTLFGCQDKIERQISRYENGALRFEVELINGKRNGLGVDYYEDGKIKATSFWNDGIIHGEHIIFRRNGDTLQINNYNSMGLCLFSKDFSENGSLEEIREYDSLGRIFDYYYYNTNGSRDFRREKKDPIFIPEQDTVVIGEYYSPMIRLGNRQFPIVDVIIGDPRDEDVIVKNKPLPKQDALTSILNIKTDSLGLRKISGVVFEHTEKIDSFDIIPFTHRYFVKPK